MALQVHVVTVHRASGGGLVEEPHSVLMQNIVEKMLASTQVRDNSRAVCRVWTNRSIIALEAFCKLGRDRDAKSI